MTLKVCSKCKEHKYYAEFNKDKQKSDGYTSVCRSCKKEDYQEKKEKYAERNKKYRQTDNWKESMYKARTKQRSNKHNVIFIPQSRKEILDRDNRTCQICKCRVHDKNYNNGYKAHIDHIIPLTNGGSNELSNLQVLCQRCNVTKGNRGA
jgi:5-methylcytosine-specific restriction endonuclease McrA